MSKLHRIDDFRLQQIRRPAAGIDPACAATSKRPSTAVAMAVRPLSLMRSDIRSRSNRYAPPASPSIARPRASGKSP